MGGEEYSDLVVAAHDLLSGPSAGGTSTEGSVAKVLVHDRDPSHRAHVTTAACERIGLKNVLLPTHCPDLTPHDATFLGCVKNAWYRKCCEQQLDWASRQRVFLSLIMEQDPNPHIERWERVLQACIDEKGGHIERRMQKRSK